MCRNISLHPGGVPDLCDPSGVGWRFWIVVRGCRLAPPPTTFWQAFGLRGWGKDEPDQCGQRRMTLSVAHSQRHRPSVAEFVRPDYI